MPRLLLATTLTAALACASVEKAIVAEPGVNFTLGLGKTASISGTTNRLTFRRVSEDSRCPTTVVCVWEGAARIEVALSRNGAAGATAILSLTPPNNEARLGDLVVRFVGLAPYPVGPGPAPREYVAELAIVKL